MVIDDKLQYFEEPVRPENRGRSSKLPTSSWARSRYSTEQYWLLTTHWSGYNKIYPYYCSRHHAFFLDFPQSVIRRRNAKCRFCRHERNLDDLSSRASVLQDRNYTLITTRWRGVRERYLVHCGKHDEIYMSTYHDLVNKEQDLKCCFHMKKYKKRKKWRFEDVASRFLLYRIKEE